MIGTLGVLVVWATVRVALRIWRAFLPPPPARFVLVDMREYYERQAREHELQKATGIDAEEGANGSGASGSAAEMPPL